MASQIIIAQFAKALSYLPIYIAQRRGFFKAEGLDVTIVDALGDHSTWDMVANGKAHFGVAVPLLMVGDHNVKGLVVAAILERSAAYGITRKQLNPLLRPLDFAGKTIAVFQSPSTSFALLRRICADCISAGGVEPRLVQFEPTTEMGYLAQTDIDIVIMTEPAASFAEHEGANRVFSGCKYFGKYLNTGLFGRADYIEADQGITQGVVSAVNKSLQLMHTDHLDAIRVARDEFSEMPPITIEIAVLKQIQENIFPNRVAISDSAWYALRQIRSDGSDMPLFRDYVENKYALKADTFVPPAQEMVSLKLGYLGLSLDLKAVWRNFRRWQKARRFRALD
jgi:NitT/TauT family transport system substrate-binding protein